MKGPVILATGEKWISEGTLSFFSAIEEAIRNSRFEIVMTIYVLSDLRIIKFIEEALCKGVYVTIFIYENTDMNTTKARDRLFQLSKEHTHLIIESIEMEVLHAKILVSDERRSIVGSANLTIGGLIRNYELGIMIDDEAFANKIISLLRRLRE